MLSFNQGFAKILGGINADLLIESDHGGSYVFGPVDVRLGLIDELDTSDDDAQLDASPEEVRDELSPDLRKTLADADGSMSSRRRSRRR